MIYNKVAEEGSFPEHIMDSIHSTNPYAEGRSFHVDVKCAKDLEYMKALLEIKNRKLILFRTCIMPPDIIQNVSGGII